MRIDDSFLCRSIVKKFVFTLRYEGDVVKCQAEDGQLYAGIIKDISWGERNEFEYHICYVDRTGLPECVGGASLTKVKIRCPLCICRRKIGKASHDEMLY